jgi:SAM-dependent methyltransferase
MLPVERVFFRTRLERAQFIAARLHRYITGKVLDVGCDEAHLKSLLSLQDYVVIDVGGKPDLLMNLERIDRLPFPDASFGCVICCEVLEHLDNLHFIFAELVRVSQRYLIISLPNNWGNARRPIERGRGSIGHYGLPLQSPPDRHKWFFALSEAKHFLESKAGENKLTVVESFATEKPRPGLVSALRRVRYPDQLAYLNRYAHTYWTVLAK